ncbi:MAG: hypothetical protein H6742_20485 [Alphaproteobacteria bacterium]|nr:hypothetical protein [Alphaproteobacteria bacterium]
MPDPDPTVVHRRELRALLLFSGCFVALGAVSYLTPATASVRPWIPGEPVPLLRLLQTDGSVQEDAQGELVVKHGSADADDSGAPDGAPPDATASSDGSDHASPGAAAALPPLPRRSPARPTPIEVPDGAWEGLYRQLAMAEQGYPGAVVRVLHWGDSTIAGDGITMTVRDRLQDRFGDAGPGFLAVHVDPRWALRPGIARWTQGPWESLSITFGGAESDRYGLAGTVATAPAGEEATATLGGRKRADAERNSDRQLVHHVDVFYQKQPGGGGLTVKPKGAPGRTLRTDGGDRTFDAFERLDSPDGSPTVWLKADGSGPVTVYGLALETDGPGLTWETFGVAGSGQGSMLQNQGRRHLQDQVARRDPQLLVYMTGGNELGYGTLSSGEGEKYLETYLKVLERLRAGAPHAACLVVTPLDQATRERGQIKSKPLLTRMVALQRQAALDAGCGFWDARAAMGGEGSFQRWLDHEPRLAWTDLMHLTDEGLELIGHSFADAFERSYDEWKLANPASMPPAWVPPPGEEASAPGLLDEEPSGEAGVQDEAPPDEAGVLDEEAGAG